jgi:hypothetical protein
VKELEDPFVYEKPEWLILHEREHRRKLREARTGKPVGQWGGKREGAGKKKPREYSHLARLNITNVQQQILADMGKGDWEAGLSKLIDEEI